MLFKSLEFRASAYRLLANQLITCNFVYSFAVCLRHLSLHWRARTHTRQLDKWLWQWIILIAVYSLFLRLYTLSLTLVLGILAFRCGCCCCCCYCSVCQLTPCTVCVCVACACVACACVRVLVWCEYTKTSKSHELLRWMGASIPLCRSVAEWKNSWMPCMTARTLTEYYSPCVTHIIIWSEHFRIFKWDGNSHRPSGQSVAQASPFHQLQS